MDTFSELALLMGMASLFALIANRLRQPPILGYIAAGVIINATGVLTNIHADSLELFSKIGIVFLLFILGLELDLDELPKLGPVAFIAGIGQIIITYIVGYFIVSALGFGPNAASYIAIGLTFSSTIVVVKLLSETGDLDTLYGKITVGMLLVQDLAAIILLILFAAGSANEPNSNPIDQIALLAIKGLFLIFILAVINQEIIPRLIKFTRHDREVLFITMVSWALVFAALVGSKLFGFSIEIGALAAGVALSSAKESLQIDSWTKPLRDFFVTVFFVLLGIHIQLSDVSSLLLPAIILSIFVLIGTPLIVLVIMGLLGYKSKTSFMTGLAVAQISEFSLVLIRLGLQQQAVTAQEVTLLTIVGGITMTVSSYFIAHSEALFVRLEKFLVIFEKKRTKPHHYHKRHSKDKIIVFGFNRLAAGIPNLIAQKSHKFLVVDNDPVMVNRAENAGAIGLYGDLSDNDLLRSLNLEHAAAIVSTVPNKNANLGLLYFLSEQNIATPVILPAFEDETVAEYYQQGATFVMYPFLFTSQRLASILDKSDIESTLERFASREKKLLNIHD